MHKKFRDEVITTPGFYVFRYKNWKEFYCRRVYVAECKQHYKNQYSYHIVMVNDRDKGTCCDLGEYEWVNSYSSPYGPVEWRAMSPSEALKFSNNLYQFGRLYWDRETGRHPLSLEDVKEIQRGGTKALGRG